MATHTHHCHLVFYATERMINSKSMSCSTFANTQIPFSLFPTPHTSLHRIPQSEMDRSWLFIPEGEGYINILLTYSKLSTPFLRPALSSGYRVNATPPWVNATPPVLQMKPLWYGATDQIVSALPLEPHAWLFSSHSVTASWQKG